jgi:hypothetical protein
LTSAKNSTKIIGRQIKKRNPLRQNRRHILFNKQSGQVIVEFLFAFPAFLLLSLFVIELSLMWTDKHIIRLAAYDAARATLARVPHKGLWADGAEPLEIGYTSDSLCWQEGLTHQRDKDLRRAAVWAAARKTALISPPFTGLIQSAFGAFGLDADFLNLDNILRGNQASRFASALIQWVNGMPAALALTRLSCSYQGANQPSRFVPSFTDPNRTITMTVTYWRAPKMPFVGDILWLIHLANKMNGLMESAGLGSFMRADIDTLMYSGFRLSMPAVDALGNRIGEVREETREMFEKLGTGLQDLGSMETALLTSGFIPDEMIPDSMGGIISDAIDAGGLQEGLNSVSSQVDSTLGQIEDTADAAAKALNKKLRQASKVTTAAAYFIPRQLRLIPMPVSVRLVVAGENIVNGRKDWDGKAYVAGKYTYLDTNKGPGQEMWEKWARNLSTIAPTLTTPGKPIP